METYGNPNLMQFNGYQYISYSSTSEASADLDAKTCAVELYTDQDCWIAIGQPGETPVAAEPAAEKTRGFVFKLKAGEQKLIPVPLGGATDKVKIGVICVTSDGTLEIYERRP